jgi:hypothetical protein
VTDTPSAAHGLDFQSGPPLRGLRFGGGRQVQVDSGSVPPSEAALVGEWEEIPGRRARTMVQQERGGPFVVTIGSMARFRVDVTAGHITAQYHQDLPDVFWTTLLMSTPVALFAYSRDLLGLHAAAVQVGSRSMLISAEGGFGKTTLSAAFHMHGHRLLGEDLAAVDPSGVVYPAQALFRLRQESANRLRERLGDVDVVHEINGNTHFEIVAERRGDSAPVPLSGVILLEWSDDGIDLRPLPAADAIGRLWRKAFYLKGGGAEATFQRLADLVESVPVHVLRRPRDFAALDGTIDLLSNHFGSD